MPEEEIYLNDIENPNGRYIVQWVGMLDEYEAALNNLKATYPGLKTIHSMAAFGGITITAYVIVEA